MKGSIAAVAISLLSLAVAQPHGRRHVHEHEQRDADVVVVYTTVIETVHGSAPTAAAPVADIVPSVQTSVPAPVKASKEAAKPKNPAGSKSGSSSQTAAGSGYGFSYAPYKADESCKTVDEVKQDFAAVGKEFSTVRIYGTACNQVATVLAAAKEHNLKIFAGIYDINQVTAEANLIIEAAKGDWDTFTHISVGNELVNAAGDQAAAMASQVVGAIGQARSLLTAAGFKGKIVTVDTLVAARAHPEICAASDLCAVNCHPFFDGNVVASDAGKFVTEQVATLKQVIPKDQQIIITETGWPWKGGNNRAAVPSIENQAAALDSIKTAFESNKSGVILFTIFNDHWKKNTAATLGAEQFWGFKGLDAPSG